MARAEVLVPDWPDAPPNVGALSTLRRGGVSPAPYGDAQGGPGLNLGPHVGDDPANVAQNRGRVRALLPAEPAWIAQVHGIAAVNAARVRPEAAPAADASYAAETGVVCAVMTADCLPVLLADAEGRVVGAAHAGWRGLASGVLSGTLASMREAGAGEIVAWLGPAIGPERFEVGIEVLDAFLTSGLDPAKVRDAFRPVPRSPGKYLCDIYQLARLYLARDGVKRVAGGDRCTVNDPARFYSYRRDGVTGRQASLIWLK